MGSLSITEKPHAVCIPYPAQGHINPINLQNFSISMASTSPSLTQSTTINAFLNPEVQTHSMASLPFVSKPSWLAYPSQINYNVPPVTCIISDGIMSFAVDAANELGIPGVLFCTTSACGFGCYLQYRKLMDIDITPLKDSSYLTNGHLENVIDWIPGMKNIRVRDLPSFSRTTDPDDIMLKFTESECERAKRASAIILNTFDVLEHDVLDSFSSFLPPVYSIGPLNLLINQVTDKDQKPIESNLWKEEPKCL
ncbi:Glycosyltransferase [Quillaja saponaria]|uniref:Glycosyltransferase n=1 Tax=Quillaja saponaria TaxID=32244 RepID=A0AAD7PKI3_QUISA|nr:Glycosyltransferase [Quillaja saponaria]